MLNWWVDYNYDLYILHGLFSSLHVLIFGLISLETTYFVLCLLLHLSAGDRY